MNQRISIITINYNDASGLYKTLESVFLQNFTDFEYIVIDGGSTDESLDYIQKFQDIHEKKDLVSKPKFQWVSEPDSGIYNAMNKGIIRASGEYCLFINSGDVLFNEFVVKNLMKQHLIADIITGNAFVAGKNNYLQLTKAPERITFYTFFLNTIIHQATLIRTSSIKELGFYNENLKILADWEFFIKALFLHHCNYQAINITISVFDNSGISSQPGNFPAILREREEVFQKYFPYFIPDYRLLQPSSTFIFLQNIQKCSFLMSIFTITSRLVNRIFRLLSS
jgi:glycosyltransferase involved in cell wall biosynthesis